MLLLWTYFIFDLILLHYLYLRFIILCFYYFFCFIIFLFYFVFYLLGVYYYVMFNFSFCWCFMFYGSLTARPQQPGVTGSSSGQAVPLWRRRGETGPRLRLRPFSSVQMPDSCGVGRCGRPARTTRSVWTENNGGRVPGPATEDACSHSSNIYSEPRPDPLHDMMPLRPPVLQNRPTASAGGQRPAGGGAFCPWRSVTPEGFHQTENKNTQQEQDGSSGSNM